MTYVSPEIKVLTQEYLSATTEEAREVAFKKLRAQREKEAVAALLGSTFVGATYVHESPRAEED